jgi:hypothetical protein
VPRFAEGVVEGVDKQSKSFEVVSMIARAILKCPLERDLVFS